MAARGTRAAGPFALGVLRPNPKDILETFAEPFRRYMKAIGWEEGRNIRFLFVWAEGRNERAPALAGELVASQIAGDPLPLPDELVAAVDPARFLMPGRQKIRPPADEE